MSEPAKKLFGTDGIRGEAGEEPLTSGTVSRLIRAAVMAFPSTSSGGGLVVIGRDTRESGPSLESAIAVALNSVGVDVKLAGVIPTPAVAYLTREDSADFGIVISASHNPYQDNGIKFFGADGYKLDESLEAEIERLFFEKSNDSATENAVSQLVGTTTPMPEATKRYIKFATATAGSSNAKPLSGMTVALDAANGAAVETSASILENLGARVHSFHCEPNGTNINRDCGCTHPGVIEELVRQTGADVGVSHDGDADRVALCDESGSALDGDELMAIAAVDLLKTGDLSNKTLVATVMSNAALDRLISERGGQVIRAGVGDRQVIQEMRRGNYNFGGEQSGHLIFRDHNTTGDGIIAAVQILTNMQRKQLPLSQLRKVLKKYPQAQRQVRVAHKPPVDGVAGLKIAIADAEKKLKSSGRILVRYSGTEPLLRILVEGPDRDSIESVADTIASAAESEFGESTLGKTGD